jgi:hypothetical protein
MRGYGGTRRVLLLLGADPVAVNGRRETALWAAVAGGHVEATRVLLDLTDVRATLRLPVPSAAARD